MAVIKGTALLYGIAGGLKTSAGGAITGVAAVTSTNATASADTKRIKGNTGNTVSFVVANKIKEVSATIVCAATVVLPTIGTVLKLEGFDAAGINGKYYVTTADFNHSNESEMTMSITLLRLPGASFSDLA
jgi:hypothetical protein|tara:strand:- start:309 stop:701 length:393 start_codon:yes stop_codon:yes gene_type:complete